jgi:alkylation response protein AidB-like acyl-CoA dehydrogenase
VLIIEPYITEEHEVLRKTIRKFVEKEVAPYVEEWEEAGEFSRELFNRLGELGYLGLKYPESVGGQGGDYFTALIFTEEMNRCGCGGVPMSIAVQTDMATPPVFKYGTPEQHERFLKPALKGEKIAAIGITEPDYGSNVQGIKTRAKRDGDEWVINGTKTFITNGTRADFVTLVTRTSDEPGAKGISLFLVEMDRPGVSVSKRLDKVGMRSSDTAELIFEDVRIPHDNLLGKEGEGFYQIMWQLQGERLIAAAGNLGTADILYEKALDYAKNRDAFGQSVGNFQVIAHLLAEMKTEIEACRELTYSTAYRFSQGEVVARDISVAKLATSKMVNWVADRTLQIFGGNGYMAEFPIERLWRDSRLTRIGGGTDEIMKEIIAKQIGL